MGEKLKKKGRCPSDFIREEVAIRDFFVKSTVTPDVEKELQRFHLKRGKLRKRRIVTWSAAASVAMLAVLLGYLFEVYKLPFEAEDKLVLRLRSDCHEVTLQSGTSGQISIVSELKPEVLKINSPADIIQGGLSYSKVDEDDPVHNEVVVVPNGRTFKIILHDGSTVWLNAHSRLQFPSRFEGSERRVQLEGEGFFEVVEDSQKPFVVETKGISTTVLGTAFNVKNNNITRPQVGLMQGKVIVSNLLDNKSRILSPGDLLQIDENSKFLLDKIDLDSYYPWYGGYFYFDNQSLCEVLYDLGRWYNMDVQFENKNSAQDKIRFTADRHEPIETIVSLLNDLRLVNIEVENNTIIVR